MEDYGRIYFIEDILSFDMFLSRFYFSAMWEINILILTVLRATLLKKRITKEWHLLAEQGEINFYTQGKYFCVSHHAATIH